MEDILSQVSKERFRRRLLVSSRVLAVLLIFAIVYFAYEYQVASAALRPYGYHACYTCGYIYGMQCNFVYNEAHYQYNITEKEEFLRGLGEYNINQSPTKITGGLPVYSNDSLNISLTP